VEVELDLDDSKEALDEALEEAESEAYSLMDSELDVLGGCDARNRLAASVLGRMGRIPVV
tara:strand:- start:43 stop:222 length:180 start_codon:yes stop_codon:yes gene_type:complete